MHKDIYIYSMLMEYATTQRMKEREISVMEIQNLKGETSPQKVNIL